MTGNKVETGDDAKMAVDEAKAMLWHWGRRARLSQQAHYWVATSYSRFQSRISALLIVLTVVTGSTLFATFSEKNAPFFLAGAILSMVSAAVAGFDRSQRYLENAEKHRQAGAAWTSIVQQTELLVEQLPDHPPTEARIDAIGKQIDSVTAKSPQIPERVFNRFKIGETFVFDDPSIQLHYRPWPFRRRKLNQGEIVDHQPN
jgi:hypothetical protein